MLNKIAIQNGITVSKLLEIRRHQRNKLYCVKWPNSIPYSENKSLLLKNVKACSECVPCFQCWLKPLYNGMPCFDVDSVGLVVKCYHSIGIFNNRKHKGESPLTLAVGLLEIIIFSSLHVLPTLASARSVQSLLVDFLLFHII